MLSKYLDKQKIIDACNSDGFFFDEIIRQLSEIETYNTKELNTIYDVHGLIDLLCKINYVICETEHSDYAEKYYAKVHDLYREMKIDLTKMLGIEDIWEVI